jgi:AcrR family transcriptional regulator
MEARPPETPSARRRRAQRVEARRAILDATEALLVEDGFEAFSMRRLADRCGYTAPSIYHHFGDKQGLIDRLIDERIRRLLARLRRVPRGRDPEGALRATCEAFVRFGLQNPTHYQLLSAPRPDDSPEPESADALRALFEDPLMQLERSGRLRASGLEEAKQALWVLLHGVISMRSSRPDYPWSRTLLRTALDAMLRGLLQESGSGRAASGARRRRNGS